MLNHSYLWLRYAASALTLVYLLYLSVLAQKNKPVISKADVVYQEWFASGHSEANVLTQMGGARNCLRLIVTAEYLVVTSWFPFSLLTAFYDLEHVIPLKAILHIEQKRAFGVEYLLLTYQNGQGHSRKIGLTPKNRESFLEAIGQNAKLTV